MNTRFSLLAVVLVIASSFIMSCSPISHVSGDKELGFLAGEENLDVKFVYKDMKVGDMDEDEYVKEKVREKNQDEEGEGDDWKRKWYEQREAKLEPEFLFKFNDYLDEKDMHAGKDEDDAKYLMIIHITKMEPGFYAGPMNDPGYINADMKFVKKENTGNVLSEFRAEEATWRNADGMYAVEQRLKSSYKALAVHFGRYVREQTW